MQEEYRNEYHNSIGKQALQWIPQGRKGKGQLKQLEKEIKKKKRGLQISGIAE